MMRSWRPRDKVYEGGTGEMVKGLGLDLCEISRMEKLLENERFLTRCYSLSGKAAEKGQGDRFWLSISHDGGMAAAVCVREDSD